MPRRRSDKPKSSDKPAGIADAALKGARAGEEQSAGQPAQDAKTVNPDVGGFGGPAVFPAPSAQPSKSPPTEQPAKIDVSWVQEEDDDTDWRRAGGADPNDGD